MDALGEAARVSGGHEAGVALAFLREAGEAFLTGRWVDIKLNDNGTADLTVRYDDLAAMFRVMAAARALRAMRERETGMPAAPPA